MPETAGIPDFNSPVGEHARKDFPLLDADMTVAEALDRIRREGVGERVIYFFAVDSDKHLVGVLPTRRLLTARLESPLREIMVRRVIAIPAKATVLDACEFFVLYKFVAFFLTMVLGLNESVSAQSMSVTIQMLRSAPVTWSWFATALRREFITAVLIGLACGTIVGAIVLLWRHDPRGAFAIGGSIALSLISASLFGLGVPSLLHRFNLDPKIAAGPLTLALADIFALLLYFTSAALVLR